MIISKVRRRFYIWVLTEFAYRKILLVYIHTFLFVDLNSFGSVPIGFFDESATEFYDETFEL